MFNIFKKKSETEKLEKKYRQLLEDAYRLSTINRKAGDQKLAEANRLLLQMEAIKIS